MSLPYAGRLAIIAGGFGGLGSATAKLLHSKGASIVLLYAPFEASRREAVLESTFGSKEPQNVICIETDITEEGSVKEAFGQIAEGLAKKAFPSILINAAGYVSVQPLEETSAEEAMKNLVPNLMGPFIVSNAFFKIYRSFSSPQGTKEGTKPPGRIVSISSQAAHLALDGHGAYCASKAGLLGLTRCQANEWGQYGVTSNSVSPTVAMTELGRKAWGEGSKKAGDHLERIPAGRFVEPDEVANVIEYLCRDKSGMVNGADIRIDGGFTISGGFSCK